MTDTAAQGVPDIPRTQLNVAVDNARAVSRHWIFSRPLWLPYGHSCRLAH